MLLKKRHWTVIILAVVTVFLIVWDVYAFMTAGTPGTVSDIVLDFAGMHPVLPFIIGVLMGHLLWPQYRVKK